jgi:hypothetical protein
LVRLYKFIINILNIIANYFICNWRIKYEKVQICSCSLGCPNLASKAYTSANTEILLNNAAKDYINHRRGVQFQGRQLVVSSIYKWYQVDFGNVKKHLIKYAKPRLAKRLRSYRGSFSYHYDWNLNRVERNFR